MKTRDTTAALRPSKKNTDTLRQNANSESIFPKEYLPENFGQTSPRTQRRVVFHCGPTNSGKTYDCFEAIRKAKTAVYAAPLRLLAMEGWRALHTKDNPCTLITGEEKRLYWNACKTSCTIEALDLRQEFDVAVLDEIQMLADPSRGWAWTKALLCVRAKTVYLAGSAEALPWVRAVLSRTQDTLDIIPYDREKPLIVEDDSSDTAGPGDAVVTFSRRRALQLREEFLQNGQSVALIYGGLPPEVRQSEAARFACGKADVLVATDAIGMGLNLPIKRVLFTDFQKFDGYEKRVLHPEEIRQIAGRAGRRGLSQEGRVGAFNCHTYDPAWLRSCLRPAQDRSDTPKPWWQPTDDLPKIGWEKEIKKRMRLFAKPEACFAACFDDGFQARVQALSKRRLHFNVVCTLLKAPAEPEDTYCWNVFLQMVKSLEGPHQPIELPSFVTSLCTQDDMQDTDQWTRVMTFMRWIDTQWPNTFWDSLHLHQAWESGAAHISYVLETNTPFDKTCKQCAYSMPSSHRFNICNDCHDGNKAQQCWIENY